VLFVFGLRFLQRFFEVGREGVLLLEFKFEVVLVAFELHQALVCLLKF
jgi:hypothetical protein